MVARRSGLLVCVLVAAMVMMLGCGRGLPGIVRTLVGTEHVCTCASGGSHAACPVCNTSLLREPRSHVRTIEGVPCGEKRLLIEVASDPVLPSALSPMEPAPASRVLRASPLPAAPRDAFVERRSRPPRSALPA
jgi:hypothetical protein